jgi:hypothetical protein
VQLRYEDAVRALKDKEKKAKDGGDMLLDFDAALEKKLEMSIVFLQRKDTARTCQRTRREEQEVDPSTHAGCRVSSHHADK